MAAIKYIKSMHQLHHTDLKGNQIRKESLTSAQLLDCVFLIIVL